MQAKVRSGWKPALPLHSNWSTLRGTTASYVLGDRSPMRLLSLLLLAGMTACAGEYAVLSTGFRIRIEGHSAGESGLTRLQTSQGTIELPAASILRFEQDDYTPQPEPVPTPPSP